MYQYSVNIDSTEEIKRADVKRSIMERIGVSQLLEGSPFAWIYNGDMILYTANKKLELAPNKPSSSQGGLSSQPGYSTSWQREGDDSFTKTEWKQGRGRQEDIKHLTVRLSLTTSLNFGEFGTTGSSRVRSAAHTSVLDVLLRHQNAKVLTYSIISPFLLPPPAHPAASILSPSLPPASPSHPRFTR